MNIYDKILKKDAKIAVIGLGYVGLPIANRAFFVISFIMNMAGIAVIGWLATAVV